MIVLWHCRQRQQQGNTLSDQYIVKKGLDAEHWKRLRNLLVQQHVLEKTASGQYVLIRDLNGITLADVSIWLGENVLSSAQSGSDRLLSDHPWYQKYDMLVGQTRSSLETNFSVSLESLFSAKGTSFKRTGLDRT
jgi:membrane protein